ncbi:hypothetical protein Dimus_023324 [Dionaea muscipula]
MEPAKIDWKTIDSEFEPDDTYENINAPQWIDFLAHHQYDYYASSSTPLDDDDTWFCRPDCKHPKTAEDFLRSTPPTSKLLRSVSVSKFIGIGDWNWRDGNYLKRRGGLARSDEYVENHHHMTNLLELAPTENKSSAEKKKKGQDDNNCKEKIEKPRLKSNQSASDLFGGGGRDILNRITDLCNELKRMAMKGKQDDGGGHADALTKKKNSNPVVELKNELGPANILIDDLVKERKPLLEVSKNKQHDAEKVLKEQNPLQLEDSKDKARKKKKRAEDAENIHPLPLDLKNVKGEDEKRLLAIRTSPPTPQCFSATRDPAANTRPPPPKAPKSRLREKEILQEVKQNNKAEELGGKTNARNTSPFASGREGRALDVFWFLKPCTLSSSSTNL